MTTTATTTTATTLRALRLARPALFYAQDWFDGEAFADDTPAKSARTTTPTRAYPTTTTIMPQAAERLPSAVELAALYVADPSNPVWRNYLWTRDTDRHGQRVYVGGTANGHGFEIHRHLHLTTRFGIPVWR